MSLQRLLQYGLLAAALSGCGKIEQSVSRKDQAIDDLNRQQYPDAIGILEGLLAETPNDGELKVLLASAYSGSVGFNVIDAFDAFEPLLFRNIEKAGGSKLTADAEAAADEKPAAAAPLHDLEKGTVKFLDQLTTNFKSMANVPFTPLGDRRRLVQGLLLLGGIPETDPHYVKARTYSSLLNALQFLNYTRDGFAANLATKDATFLDAVCALEVQTFLANLDTSTGYLLSSLHDLTISYKAHKRKVPSDLTKLKDAAVHVKEAYETEKDRLSDADLAFTATKTTYCK